jgi:hypothetical protein
MPASIRLRIFGEVECACSGPGLYITRRQVHVMKHYDSGRLGVMQSISRDTGAFAVTDPALVAETILDELVGLYAGNDHQ